MICFIKTGFSQMILEGNNKKVRVHKGIMYNRATLFGQLKKLASYFLSIKLNSKFQDK